MNRSLIGAYGKAVAEKGPVTIDAGERHIVRSVLLLHAEQALHQGLARRRGKKERIFCWLPPAVQAQPTRERGQATDCDDDLRVDPVFRTEKDDLAHLELDLANAGHGLLFRAETGPSCRNRLRLEEN